MAGGSGGGGGGGPLLAGDIKLQLFKGHVVDPAPDIFKGRVSQFGAWLHTAFMHDLSQQLQQQLPQRQQQPGELGGQQQQQQAAQVAGEQQRWAHGAQQTAAAAAAGPGGACTLTLTGAQLDKLAKALRKRRPEISVAVEYELH